MAYGSMTKEQMEQLMINELRKNTQIADYMGKPIAGFSGKGSSVKIYRNPQGGYYGDTGDFDFSANTDDGSCIIQGCTDIEALNYNEQANENDGE